MDRSDLKKYRGLQKEIQQLESRLWISRSSPEGSDKLRRHYERQLEKLKRQTVSIEQSIAALDNPVERMILRDRYIGGHGWAYICCALASEGYSERQVYRIHGFALRNLKEVDPIVPQTD